MGPILSPDEISGDDDKQDKGDSFTVTPPGPGHGIVLPGLRFIHWTHIFTRLRRRALPITETELKAIAAAAMIGLNKMSNQG